MTLKVKKPPPIIDSAKLLAFAYNDDDVEFTDQIDLFVGYKDSMARISEVPCLAICANYVNQNEILLFFCNTDWESKGVAVLETIEKAKLKAEYSYHGISDKWIKSPYSAEEVDQYLRDVYKVDPNSEWWQ